MEEYLHLLSLHLAKINGVEGIFYHKMLYVKNKDLYFIKEVKVCNKNILKLMLIDSNIHWQNLEPDIFILNVLFTTKLYVDMWLV